MRVFNHVFNTWMFAQLLHPIIFFAYFSIILNDFIDPGALISLLVAALLISSPSLFISFLLLRYISIKNITTNLSFVLWIIIAVASIVLNIALFALLLNGALFVIPVHFIIPAFIATFLSILIRLPLFFTLITSIRKEKSYEESVHYENQF